MPMCNAFLILNSDSVLPWSMMVEQLCTDTSLQLGESLRYFAKMCIGKQFFCKKAWLLLNAIHKRSQEHERNTHDIKTHADALRAKLSALLWLTLSNAVTRNINGGMVKMVDTLDKKTRALTRNVYLPFPQRRTVANLSSYKFNQEDEDLRKNGFGLGIPPSRTDIFTRF